MAYPTGSGSEILYRGTIHNQSNTATAFRWDKTNPTTGTSTYTVPALHIISILTISITEVDGNNENFDMLLNDGTNNIYLLQDVELAGDATFIYSDRLCLVGGDKLTIYTASAANVDIHYTFIDQDWS